MTPYSADFPFRSVLSLKPLLDYWADRLALENDCWASLWENIQRELESVPDLRGPIASPSSLEPHRELTAKIMSALFAPGVKDTELMAAVVPLGTAPFYATPAFEAHLLNTDGSYRGRLNVDPTALAKGRAATFYRFVLARHYGVDVTLDYPLVRTAPDPDTGLERHYKLRSDCRFIEAHPVKPAPRLSPQELADVEEMLVDPRALIRLIPPDHFELRGFSVVHAVDVTHSEVLSLLQRDLIGSESICSQQGFGGVQEKLRILFRRPRMTATFAALQDDRVLMLSSGARTACNCIFKASTHLPTADFQGSLFESALRKGEIARIGDMRRARLKNPVDLELAKGDLRSLLIAPLKFGDKLIGALCLGLAEPDAFRSSDVWLAHSLSPLFSVIIKRALDDLENEVQRIIKQECTAIHPAVEWAFKESVLRRLEKLHRGEAAELEPVVFKDVYPLYGAADIRNSSVTRNSAIKADLMEHLTLARDVVEAADQERPMPILKELAHRLTCQMNGVETGVSSGDEPSALRFLRKEVEPLFPLLCKSGAGSTHAVARYEKAMDPLLRTVYRERRDFEESVALLNERLGLYLDQEEQEAQRVIGHYFDKHQTDGVSYMVYLGASILENGEFDDLFLRNMRLWQLVVACGLAFHAEDMKSRLKVKLETTHLVLIHHAALSIRFRFDEKRFDVDGAYDVGHEIVKSRIDKALVKGTGERLTQPGRIAVVYARPEEGQEMLRHVDFLKARGFITPEVEPLELDDLPGVHGLRALRVTVDHSSGALADWAMRHGELPETTDHPRTDGPSDFETTDAPETTRAAAL
jgi:GAF domain-containing protein